MAPIFFATSLAKGESSPPQFMLAGAGGYKPSKLSDLNIVGVPMIEEVAYQGYRSNLHAFVYATSVQQKTYCGLDGYAFTPRARLQFPEPALLFALKKEPNDATIATVLAKLGTGATAEKKGNTTVFKTLNISDDMLNMVSKISNPQYKSGPDGLNPLSLHCYRFILGFIYEFLCTHTYPASTIDPRKENKMELIMLQPKYGDDVAVGDKNTNFWAVHKDYKEDPGRGLSAGGKRKALRQRDDDMVIDEGSTDEYAELSEYYKQSTTYFQSTTADAVLNAKPSPGRVENNVGLVTDVPELPGLAFPYFPGLVSADKTKMSDLFFTYCFRLLGATLQECKDRFSEFRACFTPITNTPQGQALLHIFTVLDLAVITRARLFVVQDDIYRGCVLLGSGYAISIATTWKVPVPSDDLHSDLSSMDPHTDSAKKLIEKLEELRIDGDYTGPRVTSQLRNPAELVEVFKGLKLKKIDEKDLAALDMAVRGLNYRGAGFRQARTVQEVDWFLEKYFSSGEVTISIPCYIPTCKVNLEDRAFILLSEFGPDAPSFWNMDGQEFPCTKGEEYIEEAGKRKRIETTEGVYLNMPEVILITPKPLAVAVSDWNNKVMVKGAIRMNIRERAAKFRNRGVTDLDMRRLLWRRLVEGLSSVKKQDTRVRREADVADYEDDFGAFLAM